MKEFELWKIKNCETKNCPHEASCNGCENMWRAALEMVQRWYMEAREGRPQTFDLGLWGMLKKELGEDYKETE